MKVYRIGLIGAGWIAESKHIPSIGRMPNAVVAAICDIKPEKAHNLIKMYNLENVDVYSDYKEMLKDESLDIIHVLTPNPLHCEMTVNALKAGKHVLVEKPMACTKADCDLMIQTAKEMNKKLTVGFNWRYRPEAQYVKRMCESGELGEIYYAKAHSVRYRSVPYWGELITGNNGGGILIDGAPHSLDLVLWCINNYEPLSVKAHTYDKMKGRPEGNMWPAWPEEEFKVEDSGFALITMKNGMTIILEAAWLMNMLAIDNTATIVGTNAGIDMQGPHKVRVNGVKCGKPYVLEPDLMEQLPPIPLVVREPDPGLREEIEWLNCIENDTEPYVKPEQAAVVTQIIEGIYESARTGVEVFFD